MIDTDRKHRWRRRMRFRIADWLMLTALVPMLVAGWNEIREAHAFRITWQGSALSPNGRWLARSVNDQAVIYDVSRGRITARLPSKARDFAFSPDSGHCAYSTAAGIAIVDALTGEVVWRRAVPGSAVFAPSGAGVAIISQSSEVWNWRENGAVNHLATGDVDAIAFSSDGELLAAVGHSLPEDRWERPYEFRYQLRVWHIASGDVVYEAKGTGRVAALAFDDRGHVLALWQTKRSREVQKYDLSQQDTFPRISLARSREAISHYSRWTFSPNGRYIAAVASSDAVLHERIDIWESDTGAIAGFWNDTENRYWRLTFSTDATWLRATDAQTVLLAWDSLSAAWRREAYHFRVRRPTVPWITTIATLLWLGLWISHDRASRTRECPWFDRSRWLVALAVLYVVGNGLPYYYLQSYELRPYIKTIGVSSVAAFLGIITLAMLRPAFRRNWLFTGLSLLIVAATCGLHSLYLFVLSIATG
jgi:hypothetical protein